MPSNYFNLASPLSLQWLWLLAPLAVLFALDLRRRGRVLRLFVERSLLDDVAPRRSVARPVVKFTLWAAGLALLVLALAGPRWDPRQIDVEQRGQNILFCLDVSNSMRAQDVQPSRLEAAKSAIRTLLETLPAGHQVGLMAYAGDAELKCPLTPNYHHVLSVLDRVTYNSTNAGGTNLGDAIYTATREVFGLSRAKADTGDTDAAATRPAGSTVIPAEQPDAEHSANVLVVFTDGENHEGYAKEAARAAHDQGVGVYVIGLGTTQGAPIPIEQNGRMVHLQFAGEEVISKFDDASLRAVVEGLPSRCGYWAAGNKNVDLADIYQQRIAPQGGARKKLAYTVWDEKFQLFVGMGLTALILAALISEQRPVPKREGAG